MLSRPRSGIRIQPAGDVDTRWSDMPGIACDSEGADSLALAVEAERIAAVPCDHRRSSRVVRSPRPHGIRLVGRRAVP